MHLIDWLLILVPIVTVSAVGLVVRRYVRSVADFMAGGRLAGRYLLCTARSEMTAGAALFVASFEQFSRAGFTIQWWNKIMVPVALIVAVSGFVVYRYRQTRALTLAQFFEMRYSRGFRLFAGMVGFLAGIVNFGVIPAVGARFFVYFLNLPVTVNVFTVGVPTYVLLMTLFLGLTMALTVNGGQITVLVTDCLEGMISQIFYVVIAVVMIGLFAWSDMREVLLNQPAGHSLVNPFDTFKAKDFNLWFVLMLATLNVYGTMAWQNSHAFNSSAATPHDSRMGNILGRWRWFASGVMVTILAVCTLTFLQHPHYAAGAAEVQTVVNGIDNPSVAQQMHWPIALSHLLPAGIKGMLCAIILMGIISGDGMQLHSWGSILIQDIVVPLRRKPLTVKQHLLLLRLAIFGVAAFAFVFGIAVKNTDKLLLWWAATQAIFVAGAGIAIIGGLYWSRGTVAGAWTGMLTGLLLSAGGLITQQFVPDFFLNGAQISFFSSILAALVYVIVSRLTCRAPHDMDALLHRGAQADGAATPPANRQREPWHRRWLGIDDNFTVSDRWVTYGISAWGLLWFAVFVAGSVCYGLRSWSDAAWAEYWHVVNIWLPLLFGIGTTVWFTVGGVGDLRKFFQRLKAEKIDDADDGTVPRKETL
jgi:SSS family solute:Na+ symporter